MIKTLNLLRGIVSTLFVLVYHGLDEFFAFNLYICYEMHFAVFLQTFLWHWVQILCSGFYSSGLSTWAAFCFLINQGRNLGLMIIECDFLLIGCLYVSFRICATNSWNRSTDFCNLF